MDSKEDVPYLHRQDIRFPETVLVTELEMVVEMGRVWVVALMVG